jgi:hypothetical protein
MWNIELAAQKDRCKYLEGLIKDRDAVIAKAKEVLLKFRPVIKGEDIMTPGRVGAIYDWDSCLADIEALGL